VSDGEEVSMARRKTIGFIRGLYSEGPVIVALDSPPYNRVEIYQEYKSNRPEKNEAAVEELRNCIEEIKTDGHSVAYAPGYEADDVIFTIVRKMDVEDYKVWGTDKDLLQICNITEPWSRKEKSPNGTLGVSHEHVIDYLVLVGDASDNIKGVKGIGPKTAVSLLKEFGSIDGIYSAVCMTPSVFKPSTLSALKEADEWIGTSIKLVTLQDCSNTIRIEKREEKTVMSVKGQENTEIKPAKKENKALITVPHNVIDFRQSLEPIGIDECWRVSEAFFQSRLYSKFPTPQAIMVTIMRGRALGLDATTALDGIHVIQGKPTMAAYLMTGLVLASPKCEFLYCSQSNEQSATWVGKRKLFPSEVERIFTIDDAKKMYLTSKDNWKKQPAIMLKWRAASLIIRELFPDIINGLYATEEFE
jgi:DNA polymerase-1